MEAKNQRTLVVKVFEFFNYDPEDIPEIIRKIEETPLAGDSDLSACRVIKTEAMGCKGSNFFPSDAPDQTSALSTPSNLHTEGSISAKEHPKYASWHKRKRDFMDFFIPLADADLRSDDPKTWRDLVEKAKAEVAEHGLTIPTSLRQLRRYLDSELKLWYDQKIFWEKGRGSHPTELF